MDWFVRAFLKASLAWFGAGVLLGLSMAVLNDQMNGVSSS